jgi:prevent-host-death family protein
MLQAKVSELKSRLSAYLKRVRAGQTVLILDRATPIARLVPIETASVLMITEPTKAARHLLDHPSRVHLREPVDVVAAVRAERDER